MRAFVNVDRMLMRGLLGPDPMATRVRSLEHARSQTVDASAATLRRIQVEESELTRVLGDPYLAYRDRTKRLIPGVW